MSQPWEMVRRYVLTVPQPVAGANVSVTPNRAGDWVIHALALTLATSAVVANRSVVLKATDGTTPYFVTASNTVQAASLTQQFCAYDGSAGASGAASAFAIGWPTDGLYLPQGFTLQTSITNIDVADQISAVALWVDEFPTGRDSSWSPVAGTQVVERGAPSGVEVIQY